MRLWIPGRPAPQGSKDGNGREVSVYLRAWRNDIKTTVFRWYKDNDVKPEDLPYFRGAVELRSCRFDLRTGQRIDSPPDLDKLLRALFDGLTQARLWEDDGRVVRIGEATKEEALAAYPTGVDIDVQCIGGEAR